MTLAERQFAWRSVVHTRLRALGTSGFALVLFLLANTACGPITSTITINDAEVALEQARLEQADVYSVFEFVSAEEYLRKAKEEWGYADYQHAEEYAQAAYDFAVAARERALNSEDRSRPEGFSDFDNLEGLE